ncbi:MAG: NUDIX domain-containing protein [Pseudomonadota bacterium]
MIPSTAQSPRLAVRAVIVESGRLLLVNAPAGGRPDLWCAPGGGAVTHASLPDNLAREVHEETGLRVSVGRLLGVCEFHDRHGDFHQVDLFFAARSLDGELQEEWRDPEGIVTRRRWFSPTDLGKTWFKPDILPDLAFGGAQDPAYHPLEAMIT